MIYAYFFGKLCHEFRPKIESKARYLAHENSLSPFARHLIRAVLFLAALTVLTFFAGFPFTFSTGHPDYQTLSKSISKSRGAEKLDISILNNGNWLTACLFGGYTDPVTHMKAIGKISIADRLYQPLKSWSVWRISQVEEHETMVAYSDQNGWITFIHMNSTNTSNMLAHHKQCTSRSEAFFLMPPDQ